MLKLLNCFWQSKDKREYYDQPPEQSGRRRPSREKNEVVYVETGNFVDKDAEKQLKLNNKITKVYRTDTNSQNPNYGKIFGPHRNRQSRSHPVSPERKSLYKVYSFDQRPSFEKERIMNVKGSNDCRNVTLYAATVNEITPRFGKTTDSSNDNFPYEIPIDNAPGRSTKRSLDDLSQGVDYKKELLISNDSPKYIAEKPAEEYYHPGTSKDGPTIPMFVKDNSKESERERSLRQSKIDNKEVSPRNSSIKNQNIVYLHADDVETETKIKTLVQGRSRGSKNFTRGSLVKPMVYRADDVQRSPMSARKYLKQLPIKASKHPPLLTTADGKILTPLNMENVQRLSMSSSIGTQPIKLSVVRPFEPVDSFPLVQRGEVVVAAPMIGGGAKRGGKSQMPKSILRKGKGGNAPYRAPPQVGNTPYRAPPQVVDGYDDYPQYTPYDDDYGRGNYGQSYYDDESDIYSLGDPYSNSPRGGYYDDRYGYTDEGMDRYGREPGISRGGRPARQQIYAAQMPDITLPAMSNDTGKNPPYKKKSKSYSITEAYDLKNEKTDSHNKLFPKSEKGMMISSAQQTDFGNELDFLCFSPGRCYKPSEVNDPNSKLRWRIIIKRGDEE